MQSFMCLYAAGLGEVSYVTTFDVIYSSNVMQSRPQLSLQWCNEDNLKLAPGARELSIKLWFRVTGTIKLTEDTAAFFIPYFSPF